MFFDWVDYVGGLFEGRQIRCQIVSVPGQPELAARRATLLESADAVVLVADTRAGEIEAAYEILREVVPRCRAQQPPVGVVVQANKRDAPDSVPRATIHASIDAMAQSGVAPATLVETVATSGEGVREAFVFAVRLALDRVRWLASHGQLGEGAPEIDGPDELLERLKALMPGDRTTPPAKPKRAKKTDERLFIPDPMMPSGFIWPPVDGRALLYEVAQIGMVPALTDRGDWLGATGGWRCHSAAAARFDDADAGRRALIDWARLHATNVQRLSSGRALILADAGKGRFRLWQLVRAEPTWEDRLQTATRALPDQLARALCDAAVHLLRARELLQSPTLKVPCTLTTVGADAHHQPVYVGLMPEQPTEGPSELGGPDLVERELTPVVRSIERMRRDYTDVAAAVTRVCDRSPNPATARLARLVNGS